MTCLPCHQLRSNGLLKRWIRRLYDSYVLTTLVNVLFSRILFTGKLMALTCSICGSYYAIRHIHTDGSRLLLSFFTCVSVDALAIYIISCRQLHQVPSLCREIKFQCLYYLRKRQLEVSHVVPVSQALLEMKYILRGIPIIGVSDGGFRAMESLSTLIFIDFYVQHVISLLIAF